MPKGKTGNGRGERLLGYCETAVFGGVDDGGVQKTKARFSVNQPVTAPNLKHQSRVAGIRVKVTEEELAEGKIDGDQMTFYEKEVKVKQEKMGDGQPSDEYDGEEVSQPTRGYAPPSQPTYASQADSPLGQMKNHLDQVHGWVKIVAVLAVIGIVMGAVSLGAIFHP
jgi:hypothetical protein